jgi:DNA polymerase-3 subunit delta'
MWQVIGQPGAVGLLKHSLDSGRLAHAYLFVGPAHVGKMTLAVNLAQALNCEREERPCGQCGPCSRIASGTHTDVQIVGRLQQAGAGEAGAKKEIAIAQIRELQQAASLQPYEGRNRVFIIDGAEHLNEESANCLLKTLEEPPAGVVIVLITTNETRLLPTIVSRCQRVQLVPVTPRAIEAELIENRGVAPDRARLLGMVSRGGIGWAISAALDPGIYDARSSRLAGLIDLAGAALDVRFAFAAKLAAQYGKDRDAVGETLGLWLEWWRDLMLVKAGCPELITNVDREPELEHTAEDYSLAGIRRFMDAIRAAADHLEQNANPRLALEVLVLGMPESEEERRRRSQALTR